MLRRTPRLLWTALPLLAACSGMQTIHLSTSEPAEIWSGAKRVCTQTPCTYSYKRQGCGFPRLMATNRIVFEARTKDGRVAVSGARDYCDVPSEWFIPIEPATSP